MVYIERVIYRVYIVEYKEKHIVAMYVYIRIYIVFIL